MPTTWLDGTTTPRLASLLESDIRPSRVYDVEASPYNAVPDAFYTDGDFLSGTPTIFNSLTAAFTSADIGKTIVILKGGVSNQQDHHTTIASITSATRVVLTNAVGRTQDGARFYISRGGDQTTAIQAAIDAAGLAGGGIVLLPGVGYLTTGLILRHRVFLRGMGHRGTLLHLAASSNKPVVRNYFGQGNGSLDESAQFCGVEDLSIDGNRGQQTNISTTLAAGYTAGNSTLTLTSTAAFPNAGTVLIGTNRLVYQGKTSSTLTSVSGGWEGTTDASAANGAAVTGYYCHGIYFLAHPFNTMGWYNEDFDPHFRVRNVVIKNVKNDGIQTWGQSDIRIDNCYASYCDEVGFRPSFDSSLNLCTTGQSGRMGFYLRSSEIKLSNCKAYYAGGVTGSDGHGFMMEGPSTLEEGTNVLSGCAAQDCKAYGFLLRNRQRVVLSGTASSNSTSSVGTYTGVGLQGISSLNIIDAVCTERVAVANNAQQNALYLDVNCYSNQIRITHGAVNGSAVGTAIKSTSNLTAGNDITINNMKGTWLAGNVSGSLTPAPYSGGRTIYTLTGNVTALNAPSDAHFGCELELHFVQDGTGSRTLAGVNAIYKWAGNVAPTLSTAANRRDVFRFLYNGTNWVEVYRAVNVGA